MDNTKLKLMLNNIKTNFKWVKIDKWVLTALSGERFIIDFNLDKGEKCSIQVVAYVNTNDRNAWTWGCIDEEDTDLVLSIFLQIKDDIENLRWKNENQIAKEVKALIESKTQKEFIEATS